MNTFVLLGICLALVALLAIQVAISSVSALVWLALRERSTRWPSALRARLLLILRVTPLATAVVLVATLIAPAYVAHEPAQSDERLTLPLLTLAGLCAGCGLFALGRFAVSHRRTRQLRRDWLARARCCELEGASIPAFRFAHPFPVIAVIGVIRPRLFLADQVLEELTPGELRAAIAHEEGHLHSRDNLKRSLLRLCGDAVLVAPCKRSMERAWDLASELAADERGARAGAGAALDLAAALIKLARLAPPEGLLPMPSGAFFVRESTPGLEQRVRRSLEWADRGAPPAARPSPALRALIGVAGTAALALLLYASAHPQLLTPLHSALELVARALA
jgi:Zn-dependent protease with chaperone function